MRTKGFIVGTLLIVAMLAVSGAAFVETSQPVGQLTEAELASSGGIPSTCAEVHASALAAGTMSQERYDLAQAQLLACSAHDQNDIAVTPAVVVKASTDASGKPVLCDWTKGSCEPATD